jgi:hypothetical protein
MRKSMMVALLLAATAIGPAAAQSPDSARGGVPTETQSRIANQADLESILNWAGLLGLLGLLGLRSRHPDDGYHPAPLE